VLCIVNLHVFNEFIEIDRNIYRRMYGYIFFYPFDICERFIFYVADISNNNP